MLTHPYLRTCTCILIYVYDNDNDNEFLFRRMKRKKKIVIHKINLQNKYEYIVKEITLIHKCRWRVTTLKQRVDCNIINR